MCSLLWAQVAGLLHRIEHAGAVGTPHPVALFGSGASVSPDASSHESSPSALHSCVLFDGLCMADSLPMALPPATAPLPVEALPFAAPFASWHALFVSHFLTRGPPAA